MLSLADASAQAHEEPLWDVGLGVGALGFGDYRGADSSHVLPLPVITLTYNGPVFKADKEGLHGALLKSPFFEVNLSFDATLPVSNDASRHGMSHLRATGETGMSADFHLWKSTDRAFQLDFRVPVRTALTVDAPPADIGWTLTPGFRLQISTASMHDWKLGIYTGPLFATRKYNDYFYSVPAQDALPHRPAYQATEGYSGTQLVLDLGKHFPHYWIAGFIRYDSLRGAVFEDSPLFERSWYWSAGFIVSWSIARSHTWVQVPD